MSKSSCCVPGCSTTNQDGVPFHTFPNPVKQKKLFKDWVFHIGGEIIGMDDELILKRRRVCHIHFDAKYHYPKDRINRRVAVPQLLMPGVRSTLVKQVDNPPLGDAIQKYKEVRQTTTAGGAILADHCYNKTTPDKVHSSHIITKGNAKPDYDNSSQIFNKGSGILGDHCYKKTNSDDDSSSHVFNNDYTITDDDDNSLQILYKGNSKPEDENSSQIVNLGNRKPEDDNSSQIVILGNKKPEDDNSSQIVILGNKKPEDDNSSQIVNLGNRKPDDKSSQIINEDQPYQMNISLKEYLLFGSKSPREKVDIIDQLTIWLTDQNIPDDVKEKGIQQIFKNKDAFPEIANHPDMLEQLLKPKEGSVGILGEFYFRNTLKPLIIELYKSSEARVRLKLLNCFSDYVHTFTEEELKLLLLPEILKGMQDADKAIVRATLLCLAQLVDILGPQTVIGGPRQEWFVYNEVGPRESIDDITEIKVECCIDSANESDCDNQSENIQISYTQSEKKQKKDTPKKKRSRKKLKDDTESDSESANESDSDDQSENIQKKNSQSDKKQKKVASEKRSRKKKKDDTETGTDSANESDGELVREKQKRKCKRKVRAITGNEMDLIEIVKRERDSIDGVADKSDYNVEIEVSETEVPEDDNLNTYLNFKEKNNADSIHD